MSPVPRRMWRRRFTIAFTIGTCISLAVAAITLPRPSSMEYVRTPMSEAVIKTSEQGVSGVLHDHLPPYHRQWDGQPPRAFLVDERTNEVLAPSVLSFGTLGLNRNAVLWTPQRCSFVVSSDLYAARHDHIAVMFEVPRPRRTFFLWAALSVVLAACTVLLHFGSRVVFTRGRGRLDSAFAYAQALVFLFAAAAVSLTQFPGYPVTPHVSTDEPNINSFAAARDRPDIFRHDQLLSQQRNFGWYTPLYVDWVRLFGWLGLRYDVSRSVVILLSTAIALFGYQRLFGSLSGSAWFGCLAAISLWFLQTPYPPNEFWSARLGTPRTAFSAMLPWVVLLAIKNLDRPYRWWIPSAASGLLFYVHPVSSPALTGAVLMGLLVTGRAPLRTRLRHTAIAAAAVVAVMLPYGLVYAGKYTRTIVPDADVAKKVVQYVRQIISPPSYFDLSFFSSQLGDFVTQNRRPESGSAAHRIWLGAAAVLLLIPLYRSRPRVRFFYGTLAGFCAVTFMIPFLDLTLAQHLGTLPFQMDLIRNVRYTDVFVVTFIALAVGEYRGLLDLLRRGQVPGRNRATLAVTRKVWTGGVVLCGMMAVLYCYRQPLLPVVYSINLVSRASLQAVQGRLPRKAVSTIEIINAVQALRREGETVYGPFAYRQMYIPMTYCLKDLGSLSYANPYGMIEAVETMDETARYLRPPITLLGATNAAHRMDAQILVLESASLDPTLLASTAVIFRNRDTAVLRIADDSNV